MANTIDITVPVLPESVADATIAAWHKKIGEPIARDENIVDIETDKVVLEVPAPEDGTLVEILSDEGATVEGETVIARFKPGVEAASQPSTSVASDATAPAASASTDANNNDDLSPSVRRLVAEHHVDVGHLTGTGKGGRITKQDVMAYIDKGSVQKSTASASAAVASLPSGSRPEERVPMTRLRARIAERLLSAQHEAAILTTFNEINMKPIMDLRRRYKESFEKKHGVRLGFMSLFTKAVVEALKRFPAVNASIDGTDVVYHGYYDIGIAVSSPRGLVVPILRNAEHMSLADMERAIADYAQKAKDGKLTVEEMTGGTFTLSNGGVFGSLLSTPILNPPQSGILGMHKTEDRPVVENGEIVIRPMMYVALSYDHRIIDGKESVSFLVTIKELLEDPARILLEI
ncbi:MAG: 2-oxoglutarate dehydrogenase complex dihydrolipoyllysine-residue succinyltransferase [Gammaproteobacteria bacterium]